MSTNKNGREALFAPGEIECSPACRTAIKQGGSSGLTLLCRHITGRWGSTNIGQQAGNKAAMNGGPEEETVSRHVLAGDIEVVIVTSYVRTPSLRYTEICLPEEVTPAKEYQGHNGCQELEDVTGVDNNGQ